MELTINPRFAEQIPPLSAQEFAQLEENILEDGRVINPIIIWKQPETGAYVIVDGYNRYRIVQRHPEIPYEIFEKQFPDEYAVLAFIYKTQLGRRNLTPQQRKYLIGKQYNAEKMSRPFHGNQYTSVSESGPVQNEQEQNSGLTCERIARENNTNSAYVRRAAKYADGIDAAEDTDPGIKHDILSGTISPTDKAVTEVAKAPPGDRDGLVRQLREPPEKKSVKSQEKSQEKNSKERPKIIPEKKESPGTVSQERELDADDREGIADGPVTKVSHRKIMEIYDGLVHSEGITTEDDVIVDMQDAADTLIFRWNKCLELNPEIAKTETFQFRVRKIAKEAMEFLHKF
ncbi:MAG: ParB N-terminal domain-containing protein [Clostridiales bacterium]|nr:ParB N-terminal domain-containing protein [Clostridiales bacterium]